MRAIADRWVELVAKGPDEGFDALVSADVVDGSDEARPVVGVAAIKQRAAAVRAAFGDLEVAVEDFVASGDRVAWRWVLRGTHVGAFLGIAATGRRVVLRGVNFQRIADGRIVEHWTLADAAGAARQLRGG
jgi:steroid delta-isomerase-like uncharacterized protein